MTPRAQTESVGVILLTGVIVLTVGTAGAVVLADTGGEGTTRADLSVSVTDREVSIAHNGGESVAFDDLRIVVQHGNTTRRPGTNASGVVTGGTDDQFESGERWVWRQPLDTNEVTTVQVFDRRTNTLLAEERRYPTGESSLTPTEAREGTPEDTPSGTATATPSETPTVTPTEAPPETSTATATVTSTPTPTPEPDTTPPSVTVTTPDGGETLRGGNTIMIEWTANDSESGVSDVDIAYSTDNGSTWTNIVTGTDDDGSYDWTVPENNTREALIRVTATDKEGNTAVDQSDATFTIDSTPPTVDSVIAEDTSSGRNTEITVDWSVSDNFELVNLTVELRLDGSVVGTFDPSVSGTESSGSTTFSDMDSGDYTVVVIAEDAVNQTGTGNDSVQINRPGGG